MKMARACPGPVARCRTRFARSANPDEGTRYYAVDHLGTPRVVTDGCAVTTAIRTFSPFGLEATSGTDTDRIRFTGQERDLQGTYDSQTDDLDNLHARLFNPNIARFLSADPLRGDPYRPQTFNLFAYVSGNPTNFIDPFGLEDKPAARYQAELDILGDRYSWDRNPWGFHNDFWWVFAFIRPIPFSNGPGDRGRITKEESTNCVEFVEAAASDFLTTHPSLRLGLLPTFYQDAHQTRAQAHQLYPGVTGSDDVLRHTWASYQLATRWPSSWVRLAGVANEFQGLLQHDLPDLPGRLSGEHPWAFQTSDIEHNELGIMMAEGETRCGRTR